MSTSSNPLDSISVVTSFILTQLEAHRGKFKGVGLVPPLVVGIQGPQGCGKSYITSHLPSSLSSSSSPPLRTATLSLDDLYLPHSQLLSLAQSHPQNTLLQGRGQPGTHDLPLGLSIFKDLKTLGTKGRVGLPVFDKSLFGGEGDRSEETVDVIGGVDVVVFEGWMTGFGSIPSSDLIELYSREKAKGEGDGLFFLKHKLEDLEWINEKLREYEDGLWREIDCFVMLKPEELGYVWEWRLEQEHNMKAKNGGIGMTDEQVKAFIGRYMPGYELFQDGITRPGTSWYGRGLELKIGRGREVIGQAGF